MRHALFLLLLAAPSFAQDAGATLLKSDLPPLELAAAAIEAPEPEPQHLEIGTSDEAGEDLTTSEMHEPEDGSELDNEETSEFELVSQNVTTSDGGTAWRYSLDISEDELPKMFAEDLKSMGSISVGMNEAGRLVNAAHLEPSEVINVVTPEYAYCTQEAAEFVNVAASTVRDLFPQSDALRVGHIGAKEGGYLRPHKSHQAGRDVDLGFYYPTGMDIKHIAKKRELAMDIPTNWALVKAFITKTDVSVILVDKRVQARLKEYALKIGEDKEWLEKLFNNGHRSLIKHARRHRDHFHVRFYAGRSQELGRRIQPLLAKEPEQNVVIYRVKKGDNLGKIASKFGSGVKMIQKANHMTNSKLSVGRTLNIPIRGLCTSCPVPPPVVVPPRTLPPEKSDS